MKKSILLFAALFAATSLWAQDTPKVEVPVGFSMVNVHPNLAPITSFNLFGGGGQFDVNFGNVFGIKADLAGYTQGSGIRSKLIDNGYPVYGNVQGNVFTYMFGPQIKKHTGMFQPFAEGLFGAAHSNAYGSIYDSIHGISSTSKSQNVFAMALGGGIDLQVAKHLALRPVEVDYLYTKFGAPSQNYYSHQNNFRYLGGVNFLFGGAPPVAPTASCSVSPTSVQAGSLVAATISTQNFNPKHTVDYKWASNGPKISGTGESASVDTTGLAPGTYSVSATATDPREKKNNVAICNTTFTVLQPPRPPVASCSASPNTIHAGDPVTVSVNASSPDQSPLTYAYSSSAGTVSGSGASASLNTASAAPGSTITTTATITDSRGLSTSCTASVNVLTPPVTVQSVKEIGDCKFMNPKKPWRVDNECKAVLDDVALRIQQEPNGKLVVVGYAEDEETATYTQLGAQRAVNIKYYLTEGEGQQHIDAAKIQPVQGTAKMKGAKIYFVPAGATFTQEEVVSIDESQVKGQARNTQAQPKKSKKRPAASSASSSN